MYPLTKIEGETAYPIFEFSAKWLQDGEHDPKYPNWYKDLPEGTISNSTSTYIMYQNETSSEELDVKLKEWWAGIQERRKADGNEFPNVRDLDLKWEFVRSETWCLTWFSHYTFDTGQTNEEALKSFGDYVLRMEVLNERLRYEQGVRSHETPKGGICLMGGEDRWRWRSQDDGPPPCKCEGCRKANVIRINH